MSIKQYLPALVVSVMGVSVCRAEDRALLIGVNDYFDQRVRDLRGCEDDVRAVREMLVDQFGFREDQIKTLLSREATRQAILDAFESWLIAGTKPGDRVVFLNSSHGSQKKCDRDKADEPDGFDELLCPADYNPETQANAILDDEIASLLRRLEGRNVTLLIDTCHSGTITKSIDGRRRGVETVNTGRSVSKYLPPPTTRDIDWTPGGAAAPSGGRPSGAQNAQPVRINGLAAPEAPMGALRQRDDECGAADGGAGGGLIDDPTAGYAAFSACSAGQTAEEIEVKIGSGTYRRGAFTWFLVKQLSGAASSAGRPLDNQEVLDRVGLALRDPRFDLSQTPELLTSSRLRSQPFLWHSTTNGHGRIIALQDRQVRINRGAQHGVQPGASFAVEQSDGGGPEIGRIEVLEVDQFVAAARLTENKGVQVGQRIRQLTGPVRLGELVVFVEAEQGARGLSARIAERLNSREAEGVRLTSNAGDANLHLALSSDGGGWTSAIYSSYGTLRSRQRYAGMEAAAGGTLQRLRGERLLQQLSTLEPEAGDLHVRLAVDGPRSSFVAYSEPARRESIRFRIRADQDCYVTLLSIDSAGEIRLLLPNVHQERNALIGGRDYMIPAEDQPSFEILPPAGRDVVKAIATKQPLSLKDVNTKSIREQGFVILTPAPQSVWEAAVRAIGVREQPDGLTTIPQTGWGVAAVWVDTVPE